MRRINKQKWQLGSITSPKAVETQVDWINLRDKSTENSPEKSKKKDGKMVEIQLNKDLQSLKMVENRNFANATPITPTIMTAKEN